MHAGEFMKSNEYFFIDNGKGKKIKCRGLFSYHDDELDKDYILYTDDIKNADKRVNVYASYYTEQNGELSLSEIESDEEFNTLMRVFASANGNG